MERGNSVIPANDKISAKQLFAAAFMCQLSPLIRRVPAKTAEAAGGSAWLSVLLDAASARCSRTRSAAFSDV